ncbi:NAD(P)H-hydrate dehydratase [Caminicella sporogenes]|uniref:NAD(P)H-hydrate dehydratase n=1 Tax=Caminicella sporogenes TaxID=166485 RepID=UPI0025418705|nr:NAD(P)H-hydrate dehydratase [Caminicella sporogenes]WIF95326.1 NAD(P)H-hydrate dehydratase [Caminicella sporogenes]
MKVVLNEEMRKIDKTTIEKYGIPGIILMENAGLGVVEEIIKDFKRDSNFTIICGRGNNGGDGFVIARHLYNKGYNVKVFIIGDSRDISKDALINFKIIQNLNINITNILDEKDLLKLKEGILSSTVVIDALFGTGLSSEVKGIASEVIKYINKYSKYIFSVDIPSGICGDNGQVCGVAVKADKTITFGLKKCGNILYPGAEYCGELILKDIGIPREVVDLMNLKFNIITEEIVKDSIPIRKKDSHKGSYGKANVIAGSFGMTGAAILTCKSALRSGLGLLRLYIAESLNFIIKTNVPEAITVPLGEIRKGVIGINNIREILEGTKDADVLTIGPGCGNTSELSEILKRIIGEVDKPIVIDADGLNVLSKNVEWLSKKKSEIVITPHLGEMSRLTGLSIEEIKRNPIEVAKNFAQKWNVITVLKSARTIIASPKGEVFINVNGNPGMATAGCGDVLTGIITGFIAQGIEPLKAAIISVYIHGLTGDRVAEKKGEYGLIAGDIIEKLPYTIKDVIGR